MQNVAPIFFADDEDLDLAGFEDVDSLFSKLEQFEPPADLVNRIMGSVAKLPAYPLPGQKLQRDDEGLIVRHEGKLPS